MRPFEQIIANSKSSYRNHTDKIGWITNRGDIYLLCPFHKEKTPSCVIHRKTKKYFICYGCGRVGSTKWLKRKLGVELPRRTHHNQLEFSFVHYLDHEYMLDNDPIPF